MVENQNLNSELPGYHKLSRVTICDILKDPNSLRTWISTCHSGEVWIFSFQYQKLHKKIFLHMFTYEAKSGLHTNPICFVHREQNHSVHAIITFISSLVIILINVKWMQHLQVMSPNSWGSVTVYTVFIPCHCSHSK